MNPCRTISRFPTGSQFRTGLRAVVLLAVCAGAARALVPTTPLGRMNRQNWTMENGLPQNAIQAMAQTADGYLWLGTEAGLVRFDGVQFAVFDRASKPALPDNDVSCLLARPDGSLIVATGDGTILLNRGSVTPTSEICAADELQARYDDGHGGGWSAKANRGSVTLTSVVERTQMHLQAGMQLPGSRIQALLADREGAIWIGTNHGLARVVNGKVSKLPETDPLAMDAVISLLEDREGNLWIGTETNGLHVLRDQRFTSIGAQEGLNTDATTAVVEDTAGKLWVGTNGGGLNALRLAVGKPGEAATYALPDVLLSKVILSLAPGHDGELWVGTPDGLNRIRGGAVDAFTSADGLPDDFIRSLLVDRDGSLWIGTRRGLAHWSFTPDGRAVVRRKNWIHADGLGSDLVGALTRDAHGDLWIATLAGLSRLSGGKITNYTTADGLSSNVATVLLARADGTLLIGTEDRGWNLWDGKGFYPVRSGAERMAIHAILDDGRGHLWFATGSGIARCDAVGLAPGLPASKPLSCPNWIEFGTADGLRSREMTTNGHPAAWHSSDGKLWFATPKGLVVVDPRHFPVNTLPPPVAIERFAIDDMPWTAESGASVEAGHVHFEFNYAAMSFTAPQKVRYRYILEGFDKGWTEAGGRRTAYYTNIPPGQYTFRVQAANNDGVWNTAGAAVRFELRPRFHQTVWFYVALAAALVLLAIMAVRLRLRRAEREFRAVLGERSRIAREIHDTLAQGYVGVSVQLEVLSELLRRNRLEAAQKQLDAARETVREGLADARQSIWALRSQDAGETALPVRLRRMVEQSGGGDLETQLSVHGTYRELDAATEQEILRIAQEAIHNGKRHAQARRLQVRLAYSPREAALEVQDDGRGFAPSAANGRVESPPGHYGLTGMRERAEEIGGALEVVSAPGAGTTVRLTVPAHKEAEEKA